VNLGHGHSFMKIEFIYDSLCIMCQHSLTDSLTDYGADIIHYQFYLLL